MRTQRQRYSRTLLESLESRTLLSTTPLGDPADTDPSSIPLPPIQVPQVADHVMSLSGAPEVVSQSADTLDIKLGTMTDSRAGTAPADYVVWAMLTTADANFSPFATGEAIANAQGGFDLMAHFQFADKVPSGVVTVHYGVYWAGLLGQSQWPAELALGAHGDLTLADSTPTAPTIPADPVDPSDPGVLPPPPATHHHATEFLAEFHQLFGADFDAWDAARSGSGETLGNVHDFITSHPGTVETVFQAITIDGLSDPLTPKKTIIKHVTISTLH